MQLRKLPAATLLRIFKLPCAQAGQLFYLHTGAERYKAFHSFDPSNTNEPSPFGIETEKAHLCCTTPVKRRRTLAALCLILRQHTVSDAKLIDDIALFAGRHAHFLADVLHIDLQLLDAAIVRISPDLPNDGGIQKDKRLKWMLVLLYPTN